MESTMHDFSQHMNKLECNHGIRTPRASLYMPDRFRLLTVTTTCDFKSGGATKLIMGSS